MTSTLPNTETNEALRQILHDCHTLAIVGLSPKADRPSYVVARYMQQHGYRIVPINPAAADTQILGETVYADLHQAAAAVLAQGDKIDLVDVFRKSEDVLPIAGEAIAIGARVLWLQLGVQNNDAIDQARCAGLLAVQNRCVKIEHTRLIGHYRLAVRQPLGF
jgi:predicted CoA-binding protein